MDSSTLVKEVDATGLQCPGPIMRLKSAVAELEVGQSVRIVASDPAFAADVGAWCRATGHELVEVGPQNGHVSAVVTRRAAAAASAEGAPARTGQTMVVFSDDLDRALAAFVIANGAAAMGSPVTLFFTFWGINILRRPQAVPVKKRLIERMFGWMMPRGAGKLALSKMHMAGLGTRMMKGVMRSKHIASLEELIGSARQAGVRLVACNMSMDLMGIRREELIDGVELGGVAMFLENAQRSATSLFI